METTTATSGSAMSHSSAIWPGARASPSRAPAPPSRPGASRIASGSPISVLKFAAAGIRGRGAARASPARMSLVEVLPVEPVTPITLARSARRRARASACSAASGSSAASRTPGARAARRLRMLGRDQHPPGAGRQRLRGVARRRPRARRADPTNRSPAPAARESITARAGPPRPAGGGCTSRAPAAWATCSGVHSRMPVPQRLARDRDVVEGHLAPARELLALLVALAGDHHHVAGTRLVHRPRDRRAAVDQPRRVLPRARQDLADDRLGILRARVVGGDDRLVGQLARRSAPSAGACPGRGRRRRRTPRSRRPSVSSRAARSTFSSESGVCA